MAFISTGRCVKRLVVLLRRASVLSLLLELLNKSGAVEDEYEDSDAGRIMGFGSNGRFGHKMEISFSKF